MFKIHKTNSNLFYGLQNLILLLHSYCGMEEREKGFTDIRALKGFRGMRSCYHSTIRLSKTKNSQFSKFQLKHKFYWQQNKLGGNVTGDFSLLFVKIHQYAALTSLYCTILSEIKHYYQSHVALVTFFYHLATFQTYVFL